MSDDDYVYDEVTGEWLPAADLAARQAAEGAVEVRDACLLYTSPSPRD